MEKKNIAVIFGGVSSEHKISEISASSVINNLSAESFNIIKIGITSSGKWFLVSCETSEIANGNWETAPSNKRCVISTDPQRRGIFLSDNDEFLPVDVFFPVLHGKNGEDGTVQGLLELARVPYVGCGVLASASCMDKAVTNMLLEQIGVAQAKFIWFYVSDWNEDSAPIKEQIAEKLGYPVFVKPANAGSSVGISKVASPDKLAEAIAVAANEDDRIVVEESISGREVECAVMGNDKPIASVVGEILPAVEFYTFEAKYQDANSRLCIPADLPEEISEKIRKTAIYAYRMLGCSGLSRVDFFVRHSDNAILLNEINTLPGFTSISMYPKLFAASGVAYAELLEKLIDLAIEKNAERKY